MAGEVTIPLKEKYRVYRSFQGGRGNPGLAGNGRAATARRVVPIKHSKTRKKLRPRRKAWGDPWSGPDNKKVRRRT